MAKSRFEYVRNFELPDPLLPGTFIVVRVDGKAFHKFSDAHAFEKPNDVPALDLMNRAAQAVMDAIPDVVLAFGESDEYSFLIRRQSGLYNRRRSKINSTICSIFTSSYVFYWSQYLPDRPLQYPPSFDSRVVLYPSVKEVRDYFAWRQADTHINNLYNTCFWALVKSGLSTTETNRELQGTDSKDKNEILFSRFGINYNNLPEMFRKGSTLVRQEVARSAGAGASSRTRSGEQRIETGGEANEDQEYKDITPPVAGMSGVMISDTETGVESAASASTTSISAPPPPPTDTSTGTTPRWMKKEKKEKKVKAYEGLTGDVQVMHVDIIGDSFWTDRPWLLA